MSEKLFEFQEELKSSYGISTMFERGKEADGWCLSVSAEGKGAAQRVRVPAIQGCQCAGEPMPRPVRILFWMHMSQHKVLEPAMPKLFIIDRLLA